MLKSPQGLLSLVGLPAITKDVYHGNLDERSHVQTL